MRYTGIQPQYFPRLHYFARILDTDIFMIRDDAQFVRKHKYPDGRVDKSFQAHTPIKQAQGIHYLGVSTKHKGYLSIAKTEIYYDTNWIDVTLKSIRMTYSRAKNFDKLYREIESILNQKHETLADLNTATIVWGLLHLLGEDKVTVSKLSTGTVEKKLTAQKKFRLKKIRKASLSKAITGQLTANEKIVMLMKEINANEDYCGGTGATAYIDKDIFAKNGLKITVQNWKCKDYPQLFPNLGFLPNLSIIDLLMNVSTGKAAQIIAG